MYVGMVVHGPDRPRFRWARTVSNLAFASLYLYEMDRGLECFGALAEVAFLSVTERGRKKLERTNLLFFEKAATELGCAEVLNTSKTRFYTGDDHRYRYLVNCNGLGDLYLAAANG